jgi:hypothetical protein
MTKLIIAFRNFPNAPKNTGIVYVAHKCFIYSSFVRPAQAGCTPPVYTEALLSPTCFLVSAAAVDGKYAHRTVCTCPASRKSERRDKLDVPPSPIVIRTQSQCLSNWTLSGIEHSGSDLRKEYFLTIVWTDTEPGSVTWNIVQLLTEGQCSVETAINIHVTQFLLHRRRLEVSHLWIT